MLFSPVAHTFLKAIKNNQFLGWPGLNEKLIKKHLPLMPATVKGHLHQEKQGLQSTKQLTNTQQSDLQLYMNPPSDVPNVKTH